MIIQASKRGGGINLSRHLLSHENEHVELADMRGFIALDLPGAMKEAYALSLGTRCQKYLFSVSFNPPGKEAVRTEAFESAIDQMEERLGLSHLPRAVVYHEKEGRRHCHVVYCRIQVETMTAKDLPHFKLKLKDLSKQLYVEHGWQMPRGFMNSSLRDPRNFSLQEWQAAKRTGLNAKEIKAAAQECWAVSKDLPSLLKELEAKGLFIARGDKRGHVVVSYEGEVFALSRVVGKPTRDIKARLGDPDNLHSVKDTIGDISKAMTPRLQAHIREAKRIAANQLRPLQGRKQEMALRHENERRLLNEGQTKRHEAETNVRASRLPTGFKAIWHRLTGEYQKVRARNEVELHFCQQRDRDQRNALVTAQLDDRQALQSDILQTRDRATRQLLGLYHDAARYRQLGHSQEPRQRILQPRKRSKGLELG